MFLEWVKNERIKVKAGELLEVPLPSFSQQNSVASVQPSALFPFSALSFFFTVFFMVEAHKWGGDNGSQSMPRQLI